MFDDVTGRHRGRQEAEIVSAVTEGRRTMRHMYNMMGTNCRFGQPTIAEISLKCPLHVKNRI